VGSARGWGAGAQRQGTNMTAFQTISALMLVLLIAPLLSGGLRRS
jgi:hypothetical protein